LDAFSQIQFNQGRSAYYEAEGDDVIAPSDPLVQLFAFYLPQFHAIPENDEWWGKGFTEWTNVTRGLPRFQDHFQPRLPADLGFYDLRLAGTLRAQWALAKRYGMTGFCFHWYWFSGKRLLEGPLRLLLADPAIDMPFFVNWANESWTRRWDGQEKSILMEQRYAPEDDVALADAFLEFVKDPRYVRIEGRAVVMIYTPSAMPDAAASIARWRARFVEMGERSPYVMTPHRHDEPDVRRFGIDAVVQYPPHNVNPPLARVNDSYALYDAAFTGNIFHYDDVAEHLLRVQAPGVTLMRGLCPSWDNEARRPNGGMVYQGSTPAKYGTWLARACQDMIERQAPAERFVFINAWNEWAEGAYLEPDRHFGHAYLRENARALHAVGDRARVDSFVAERQAPDRGRPPSASPVTRFIRRAQRKIARRWATRAGES
jgi:lipopolysaccharide biosynthesis protein